MLACRPRGLFRLTTVFILITFKYSTVICFMSGLWAKYFFDAFFLCQAPPSPPLGPPPPPPRPPHPWLPLRVLVCASMAPRGYQVYNFSNPLLLLLCTVISLVLNNSGPLLEKLQQQYIRRGNPHIHSGMTLETPSRAYKFLCLFFLVYISHYYYSWLSVLLFVHSSE